MSDESSIYSIWSCLYNIVSFYYFSRNMSLVHAKSQYVLPAFSSISENIS